MVCFYTRKSFMFRSIWTFPSNHSKKYEVKGQVYVSKSCAQAFLKENSPLVDLKGTSEDGMIDKDCKVLLLMVL